MTAGRRSSALLLFVLPALIISAPARAGDGVKAGAALYAQMCTHCHGPDMVNPGTSSFDLRKFPRNQADRFYESVRNGKGNMPAWGDLLKPFEIDQLWAYVSSRGGKLKPVKKKLKSTASHRGN